MSETSERPGLAARALAGIMRGYQLVVSPWFAPRCRYYPSCSTYAIGALRTHGALRGTGLAIWRVLRCNPWSRGGVDPVPPRHHNHRQTADSEGLGEGAGSAPAPEGRTLGGRTSRRARA